MKLLLLFLVFCTGCVEYRVFQQPAQIFVEKNRVKFKRMGTPVMLPKDTTFECIMIYKKPKR